MSLTSILMFAINVQRRFVVDQASKTTNGNVAPRVRDWMDSFNLRVQNSPDQGFFFRYIVTMPNGDQIYVSRPKEREHYVVVFTKINTDMRSLNLNPQQAQQLVNDLFIEASRAKITFANMQMPLDGVYLEKRIPITSSLTEDQLIGAINDMDSAMILLLSTARGEVIRLKK